MIHSRSRSWLLPPVLFAHLVLILLSCSESRKEKERQVDLILGLNNSRDIAGMMSDIVLQELASVKPALDSLIYEQLYMSCSEFYDPDSLLRKVREKFMRTYRSDYAREAIRWMHSGSYQRILAAEEKLLGLKEKMQIMQLRDYIGKDDDLSVRYELLRAAVQPEEIEMTAETFGILKMRLFETVSLYMHLQQPPDEGQLMDMVERDKSELRRVLQENAIVERLYRYRHLSVEDLEAYSRFSNSDAGRWLVVTTCRSFFEVIAETSERLMQAAKRELLDIHAAEY